MSDTIVDLIAENSRLRDSIMALEDRVQKLEDAAKPQEATQILNAMSSALTDSDYERIGREWKIYTTESGAYIALGRALVASGTVEKPKQEPVSADPIKAVVNKLRKWSIKDGSRCMDDFADELEAAHSSLEARLRELVSRWGRQYGREYQCAAELRAVLEDKK